MAIQYTNDVSKLSADQLTGFFVGWPQHPDPDTHLDILHRSYVVWVAMDGAKCVGFINALSDGLFCAYIPLLEVLPEYQGAEIGAELLSRMVDSLESMYAIDIVCDEPVASFYEHHGFSRCVGMVKRHYNRQGASHKRLQRDQRR